VKTHLLILDFVEIVVFGTVFSGNYLPMSQWHQMMNTKQLQYT